MQKIRKSKFKNKKLPSRWEPQGTRRLSKMEREYNKYFKEIE
jgi:hypothetical protein